MLAVMSIPVFYIYLIAETLTFDYDKLEMMRPKRSLENDLKETRQTASIMSFLKDTIF